MSAGELFDIIWPVAFVFSALLSTWVLASARKRFRLYYALALAVATLLLPLIVFPLYLAIMLWRKPNRLPTRWRYTLPLTYAVIILAIIAGFYYSDTRSVDAHLARANRAKLREDPNAAIREYRQALALEDDPHTHKLLGVELANAGNASEAISELRLAQKGGEPDDSLHYRLGMLLERLNQPDQAKLEFNNFLLTEMCKQPDARCEEVRLRLQGQLR